MIIEKTTFFIADTLEAIIERNFLRFWSRSR